MSTEKKVRAPRAKKEKPVIQEPEPEDDYDDMEVYMRIFKDRLAYHIKVELDALDSKAYGRAFDKFMDEMKRLCAANDSEFNTSFSEVVPVTKS